METARPEIRPSSPSSPYAAVSPAAGPRLGDLLALAARLAAEPGLARRLPAPPDRRAWLRLHTGPGTAAWLIAWPPGTGTAWHDHGGAAGAMVALEGALTERSIEASARHPADRPLPLPGGAGRVRALAAGQGRAFTGRRIHEVVNDGTATAYSVHVYAPDLALMRHYVPVGETLVLIGLEAGRDW